MAHVISILAAFIVVYGLLTAAASGMVACTGYVIGRWKIPFWLFIIGACFLGIPNIPIRIAHEMNMPWVLYVITVYYALVGWLGQNFGIEHSKTGKGLRL